jgi:phosphopantothenoylcysteine decarboxylase/phosphopantothenate--cysteine ligase
MSASGREVVLGIGGGIAAYKSCDLLRRLKDLGFLVTVVPTPASLHFVGTTTWEALSGRPVLTQLWQDVASVPHINLANRADYIVIGPATADLIARMAQGRADDLLTNIVLATGVPKLVVPAMHPRMWQNPATIATVETLRSRGFIVMDPEIGRLTGSDVGQGRFPETSKILEQFQEIVGWNADLQGRTILVTAGGTREPIDPIRYIGNRSSGKQGYAVAQAAIARGAQVELIAANCELPDIEGVEITQVETTADMARALDERFARCDALIMCAAVADAKPVRQSSQKIKKSELHNIELEANPDLLAGLSSKRKPSQVLVGFAAETQAHLENASKKLLGKGLDLLYVNDVSNGAIFGSDMTRGTIIMRDGGQIVVSEASKDTLANVLLDQVNFRLCLPNV